MPLQSNVLNETLAETGQPTRAATWMGSFQSYLAQPHIPGLDSMRAFAATLVLIGHYADLPMGNLGVELFFVLSGFLITTLLLKELSRTGTISLMNFYRRRARRILPAYYVFWCLNVGIALLGRKSMPPGQLAATFFYFTNYYQSVINPASGFLLYTWSLAVEEQFYLLWPLLFLTQCSSIKRLAKVALAISILVLVWRSTALLIWKGPVVWYTYNAFECRADQLFTGCLLAIALNRGWFPGLFRYFCISPWLPLGVAAALGTSVYLNPGGVGRGLVGFPSETLLGAVLLVQLIWFSATSRYWRWLNSPPMLYLALISYPLYLYHGFAAALVKRALPNSPGIAYGLLGVGLSVLLAHLSYYLVEKRFLKRRNAT